MEGSAAAIRNSQVKTTKTMIKSVLGNSYQKLDPQGAERDADDL
jgi:hypothetical protein